MTHCDTRWETHFWTHCEHAMKQAVQCIIQCSFVPLSCVWPVDEAPASLDESCQIKMVHKGKWAKKVESVAASEREAGSNKQLANRRLVVVLSRWLYRSVSLSVSLTLGDFNARWLDHDRERRCACTDAAQPLELLMICAWGEWQTKLINATCMHQISRASSKFGALISAY